MHQETSLTIPLVDNKGAETTLMMPPLCNLTVCGGYRSNHKSRSNPLTFRLGVGVLFVEENTTPFLGVHIDRHDRWQGYAAFPKWSLPSHLNKSGFLCDTFPGLAPLLPLQGPPHWIRNSLLNLSLEVTLSLIDSCRPNVAAGKTDIARQKACNLHDRMMAMDQTAGRTSPLPPGGKYQRNSLRNSKEKTCSSSPTPAFLCERWTGEI